MGFTGIENRLTELNNTLEGIADDMHHFRDLIDKELAEKESRKDEHDVYRKRDLARYFVAHKGNRFIVCDEFTVPAKDVDPDNRSAANIVKEGERLTVEKVDCLSDKYDVAVTVFRNDCGISIVLTLDQIRKLIENDILEIVGKNAA